MGSEQNQLKSLGVFGIYREAYKITVLRIKLFLQITLAIMVVMSVVHMFQIEISLLITKKKHQHDDGIKAFRDYFRNKKWLLWKLVEVVYSIFLRYLSLFFIFAGIYTVASIYSANIITFKKFKSTAFKSWQRLNAVFWWCHGIMTVLIGVINGLIQLVVITPIGTRTKNATIFFVVVMVLLLFFSIGLVYINLLWELASVISVLEDDVSAAAGIRALKKSRDLIKGKIWVAFVIYFKLHLVVLYGILAAFEALVVHDVSSIGMVGRVSVGIFCFLLVAVVFHFLIVIQTVLYFVCKSYHDENIDMPDLAKRLAAEGDYVEKTSEDVESTAQEVAAEKVVSTVEEPTSVVQMGVIESVEEAVCNMFCCCSC